MRAKPCWEAVNKSSMATTAKPYIYLGEHPLGAETDILRVARVYMAGGIERVPILRASHGGTRRGRSERLTPVVNPEQLQDSCTHLSSLKSGKRRQAGGPLQYHLRAADLCRSVVSCYRRGSSCWQWRVVEERNRAVPR